MRFLFLLICVSIHIFMVAQQNNTLFLMHDLPQSNIVNPAVSIKNKYFIGCPIIGSTHLNLYSTGFKFNDMYYVENGFLHFRPEGGISNFSNLEIVEGEAQLALLSFGYRVHNTYYTFSINEKANTIQILSKNLFQFMFEGNSTFEGQRVSLSKSGINAIHYREYAIGIAKDINKKLSLGIRGKLLFGKGNIYTKSFNAYLITDENTFQSTLVSSADVYTSFPFYYNINNNGQVTHFETLNNENWLKYAMNNQNLGLGLDIGAIYKFENGLTISASILDIGFIHWKTNATLLHSEGTLELTAESYANGLDHSEELIELFKNTYYPYISYHEYTAQLFPATYLGCSKLINNQYTLGLTLHNEYYKHIIHNTLTLSANTNITENINTSISYSIQNKQATNIGLGIGVTLGKVQIHAISDNVPAFFSVRNTRNFNLRFGLSFLWGKVDDTDKKKNSGALPCYADPYVGYN